MQMRFKKINKSEGVKTQRLDVGGCVTRTLTWASAVSLSLTWIVLIGVVPEPPPPPLSLCHSIFPSPEQNPGLCHYQGLLNTGGSLPDLSNLHFPSPLSTPLDPEDSGAYPNLSGGSSTGNLPAAMMHLGIGNSQGGPGTALCLHCSGNSFTSVFVSSKASLDTFPLTQKLTELKIPVC